MYKRITLLTTLSFFVLLGASAQTKTKSKVANDYFDVVFGDKLQLNKEFIPRKLLSRKDGGYAIQSFGKGKMGIDLVNGKFEQTESKMHDIRRDLDRRDENLVSFGGRTFWVCSSVDDKTKDEKLYLQEINDATGDFYGDELQVNKTKDVHSGLDVGFSFFGGGMGMSFQQNGRYFTSISPDETKLLVYYKKKPVKRSNKLNKDIYGFIVVDENFDVLWKKEVEMPKTEFMMSFLEAEVTNDGTVIYLAKVYKDENRKYKKDSKPNYTLSLFEVDKDTKKAKEKAMDLDGFVQESELFINDEGEIVVCGTFSKLYKGSGSSGVFYNIVDMSQRKVDDAKYMDFDSDLDANFEGPKHAKKLAKIYKKYGVGYIPYLRFRNVFFDEKAKSIYMILESYHLVVRKNSNSNTYTYYYYYDDVYALKVNTANQQIDKAYKIPKRQLGINTYVDLGISSFMFDEQLYVFFVDNKKNLNLAEELLPAEHRSTMGGFLSGVRLDFSTDEGPERFLLYDAKIEKKYCDPSKFVESDGIIYGVGYEKAKGGGPYYPIKISFK